MKGAALAAASDNLFGVYITNFSCGPDSFLLGYFREAMGDRPSLTLELDEHTADAGIDTRIEAALEIMKRWRNMKNIAAESAAFKAATCVFPWVETSEGERLHISDKRVEVLVPSFGSDASAVVAAMLRGIGVNAKALPTADGEVLRKGRRNTTCKECLPYIVNTGAFLTHIDNRAKDSVSVFMMATGGGPCRLGQYFRAFEKLIEKEQISNAAMLTITDQNGYGGLGSRMLLKAWQAVVFTDTLSDIRSMLNVCASDRKEASKILEACTRQITLWFEGRISMRFSKLLMIVSHKLSCIPLARDPKTVPAISLIGEIFVRRDEFSRKNIVEYLESRGFMVRIAPLGEYPYYGNYVLNSGLDERKVSLSEKLKRKAVSGIQEWWEERIKRIMAKSGLYHFEMIEVDKTIEGVSHLLDPNFRGECILTVGLAMREIIHDSCGVISIGPFGCMYSRMAEAMLKKELSPEGLARMPDHASVPKGLESLPFLAIETDGNPFPQLVEANLEAFVLQAKRLHDLVGKKPSHKRANVLQANK